MADYDSLYQRSLYLSPDQQDLLYAALASSNRFTKGRDNVGFNSLDPIQHQSPQDQKHSQGSSGPELLDSPPDDVVGSAELGLGTNDSPFLDFELDADFDFTGDGSLIGDLPGGGTLTDDADSREKRKSIDDDEDDEETGKKRKENDEKGAKKPGRKPLTSEPTTKRKAQNRAAQRAFRERKEKHLKDLETKVEDLEKASQAVNNENSFLRSQVNRLQTELKEYRKRMSWISGGNSISQSFNPPNRRPRQSNEFTFEFPKFGDVSSSQIFGNARKPSANSPPAPSQHAVPGIMNRNVPGQPMGGQPNDRSSFSKEQTTANGQWLGQTNAIGGANNPGAHALYGSSTAPDSRKADRGPQSGSHNASQPGYNNVTETSTNGRNYSFHNLGTTPIVSNSDSPSVSSESQHGQPSSIGTSPEPTANSSPHIGKPNDSSKSQQGEKPGSPESKKAFYAKLEEACGCADNPVPAAFSRPGELPSLFQLQGNQDYNSNSNDSNANNNNRDESDNAAGLDWLMQQNGGQFDPSLFGDYREPQDAILSQGFGGFFDDAFALPNFDYGGAAAAAPPKTDLTGKGDSTLLPADNDEVVPAEDRAKMMSSTKIWDRLQAIERFRNGELDVDNLCTELRTKARCSETGVVVNQKDVEDIMSRAE